MVAGARNRLDLLLGASFVPELGWYSGISDA